MPTQPGEACTHRGAQRSRCDLPLPWDTPSSPRRPMTQALERPASRTNSEAERCHGHREAGAVGTGSECPEESWEGLAPAPVSPRCSPVST